MKTKFFDDIERLRGFACILILIQHIVWTCPLRYVYEIVPMPLLVGSGGGRLFFAISGFVVTLSLRDAVNSVPSGVFLDRLFFAKELLFSFYKKRFFRIFPVVFFVLICLCIFLNFTENDLGLLSSFLRAPVEMFLGVYNNSLELFVEKEKIHYAGLGPFWTLAIEAQFYILWPVVLLACKDDNTRAIVSLTLGLLFMMLILPVLCAIYGSKYYLNYTNLTELFLGSFLAFLYRGNTATVRETRLVKLIAIILAMTIWFYPSTLSREFYSATVVSISSVLLVALAVFARDSFKIPLLYGALDYIGSRSFSFYAVQLLLANAVVYYTNSIHFSGGSSSEHEFYRYQFMIYIVALFIVTELVHRFIEKPCRKFGKGVGVI